MLRLSLVVILALSLHGCGTDGNGNNTPDKGNTGTKDSGTPKADQAVTPKDGSTPSCGPKSYPCGPFGLTAGQLIKNHEFNGFMDPDGLCKEHDKQNVDTSKTVKIALKDYFQANAKCPSKKKPLLWILGSASWCGICINEIKQVRQALSKGQIDKRVAFINVIIDGSSPGASPTDAITKNWITSKNLQHTVATDANRDLAKYFTKSGFPLNVLVDTKTMKIYYVKNGDSLSAIGKKMQDFFKK